MNNKEPEAEAECVLCGGNRNTMPCDPSINFDLPDWYPVGHIYSHDDELKRALKQLHDRIRALESGERHFTKPYKSDSKPYNIKETPPTATRSYQYGSAQKAKGGVKAWSR